MTMAGCFTAEECYSIIGMTQRTEKKFGIARGKFTEIRDSSVCFIAPDNDSHWIFSKLRGVEIAANQNYGFNLTGFR